MDSLSEISLGSNSVLSLKELQNMRCLSKISFNNNSVLSLKGVQYTDGLSNILFESNYSVLSLKEVHDSMYVKDFL